MEQKFSQCSTVFECEVIKKMFGKQKLVLRPKIILRQNLVSLTACNYLSLQSSHNFCVLSASLPMPDYFLGNKRHIRKLYVTSKTLFTKGAQLQVSLSVSARSIYSNRIKLKFLSSFSSTACKSPYVYQSLNVDNCCFESFTYLGMLSDILSLRS